MIAFDLNLTTLKYLLPILTFFDVYLTWLNTKAYKKLFPDKDWTAPEVNPLVRGAWKKFGLNKGTLLASIIAFGLLAIIIFFFSPEYHLILLGAYIPIIAIHLRNYVFTLKAMKKKNRFVERFPLILVFYVALFFGNLYFTIFEFNWLSFLVTIFLAVVIILRLIQSKGRNKTKCKKHLKKNQRHTNQRKLLT